MKTQSTHPGAANGGFTMIELMISMAIAVVAIGMAMSTFLYGLRTMYKDTQRLTTNSNLRTFTAHISKETLNASYFYLFPSYEKLDGSVNLATDTAQNKQSEDYTDNTFDKWSAHADCLVLITKTSQFRTTDIRQIRIYYRVTADNQTAVNGEAPIRYYETEDWGEGSVDDENPLTDDGNLHPVSKLDVDLNAINLKLNPEITGSKQIAARSKGRAVPAPYTGYVNGDRYPIFSSESPSASITSGFIAINVEFINGSTNDTILSSSSFNYTISPRR